MCYSRNGLQSFRNAFQRYFVPLVELPNNVQEARCPIRLPYSPPQRALVDELDMRWRQDPKGHVVIICYVRTEHRLQVGSNTIF